MAFSPDGFLLLAGYTTTNKDYYDVRTWNLTTRKPLATFHTGWNRMHGACFAPGKLVISRDHRLVAGCGCL